MRTALILSGEIRNAKECFPNIKQHILDQYNPDVFIHTWLPQNKIVDHRGNLQPSDCGIDFIIEAYKPKQLYIEDFALEKNYNILNQLNSIPVNSPYRVGYDNSLAWETKFGNVYFMYYSMYKAHSLKRDAENSSEQLYDFVIRARFDITYNSFPKLIPEKKCLYVPVGLDARGGLADLLSMGDSEVMQHYCNLFLDIPRRFNNKQTLHPETMLRQHIENAGITIKRFECEHYLRKELVFVDAPVKDSIINVRKF